MKQLPLPKADLLPSDAAKLRIIYEFHQRGYPVSMQVSQDDLQIIGWRYLMDRGYFTETKCDGYSDFDFNDKGIAKGKELSHDRPQKQFPRRLRHD